MKKFVFTLFMSIALSLQMASAQIYTPSGAIQGSSGSNNVGIGVNNPASKLDVITTDALPVLQNSRQLISRFGSNGANAFHNNTWIYRDDNSGITDWWNVRWHDAFSIGTAFTTPGTDTRTWWERQPNKNFQAWGNINETYLAIN